MNNKNKKTNVLVAIIVVLFCAFLGVSALAVFLALRTPLAAPMKLVTANTPVPTATAQTDPKPTKPAETCGNTGSTTLLFTGADFSMGVPPLGADAVRIVKVDYSNKKITSVAFPRDLLVKTPGLADLNRPESHLGLAYYYKKEATKGTDEERITAATTLIGQTLYDNFAVVPQNYFTLQLDSVGEMIDAIGGVQINLPESITTDHNVVFPAGPQKLDGRLSAEFTRAYLPGGDLARIKRNNLYMKALQDQMLSTNLLPKIPALYEQFDKAIVTDMTPKQLNDLACMAKEVPQSQIEFHEISGDLVSTASDGSMVPNVDKVKAKLTEWLGQ